MVRQIQTTDGYATQSLAVAGTAVAIGTASWGTNEIETAQRAYITVGLANIRATWDAVTTPTSSVGILWLANGTYEVEGNKNIRALSFIRATGVDASLSITLEK
jgi:hypothetical protein